MNWEAVGATGEVLGAVGVIATLGYLAFQIRQNTQQLRQNELASKASAVNRTAIAFRENRRSIFEDSEITRVWLIGLSNPEELDEIELYRFRLMMQNVADTIWEMHSQTIETGFSPETWETQAVGLVKRILSTAGGQWFWEKFSESYTPEFGREINRILASDK